MPPLGGMPGGRNPGAGHSEVINGDKGYGFIAVEGGPDVSCISPRSPRIAECEERALAVRPLAKLPWRTRPGPLLRRSMLGGWSKRGRSAAGDPGVQLGQEIRKVARLLDIASPAGLASIHRVNRCLFRRVDAKGAL